MPGCLGLAHEKLILGSVAFQFSVPFDPIVPTGTAVLVGTTRGRAKHSLPLRYTWLPFWLVALGTQQQANTPSFAGS